MMKSVFIIFSMLLCNGIFAQYIGIGTTTPVETLDVNGNVKVNGLIINNGGAPYDFLMKSNVTGAVGFKKGHGGLGMRYIICVQGCTVPSATLQDGPFLSEIIIFAGDFAPTGWMFCEGQNLNRNVYAQLFSLIGTNYGTNTPTSFALPDLRGAVPVGPGASPAGYTWGVGQKSN